MTTPLVKTPLQSLLFEIDEDFNIIKESDYTRRSLYYTVKIDNRETEIRARKNSRRTTFFIRTPQDYLEYTMLYLSEIDLITILSTLSLEQYDNIINQLIGFYSKAVEENIHTLEFTREDIFSEIKSISKTANDNLLIISAIDSADIKTPFGFEISYQSFCDDLSLVFSTENSTKLKIIIIKYYVLSKIIRSSTEGIPIPKELNGIKTAKDVNDIYKNMNLKNSLLYDARIFSPSDYDEYFQSLS
jgi:hypothetical protein